MVSDEDQARLEQQRPQQLVRTMGAALEVADLDLFRAAFDTLQRLHPAAASSVRDMLAPALRRFGGAW
jgi:hypothetical protein